MADRTPWQIKGTWVEACNCDFGCPCNYNGFPTKGHCEGGAGFHIESGKHGGTDLSGITVFGAVKWPGAIHEGNGKGIFYVSDNANDAQLAAVTRILTAQDGGMPFEIFAAVLSDVAEPVRAPVTFEDRGTKTKISAPGIEVELETFTNPVTGEEHEVHTVIPGGFIWKDGQVCKSARNVVKADGVEFDHSGQNAYFAKVDWSNAEVHEGVAGTRFEH